MLTTKQKELLIFIHERLQETGVPPSFDEMKEALDLKSKSGIHRLITALEERGFIRRLPHRARAIEIMKLPDSMPQASEPAARAASRPSVIEGSLGRVPQVAAGATSLPQTVSVPLMGRIAAGVPIRPSRRTLDTIEVPPDLLTKGEHFALEVKGDSMIDAGILDGDIIILKQREDARTATSSWRWWRRGSHAETLAPTGASIALEAANPAYETRIFGPDHVACRAGSSA